MARQQYQLTAADAAARLGISPVDLTAVIAYETANTMSPTIWGGKGGRDGGLLFDFELRDHKQQQVLVVGVVAPECKA